MMTLRTYETLRENVYYDRLDNGLPVFVIKKKGFQKKFASLYVNYGGMDRRFRHNGKWIDTPAGVAHFLEHKMFDMPDGTSALTKLSENGASVNAGTSLASTVYYFESVEKFEENLEMLCRFVTTPYYTKESVAKEQGIIGQEIRMTEDNPSYVLNFGLLKLLLDHHPLRDSVAGTVESIAEITDETLYNCHSVFYNPHNMCLVVSGDVDPESVYETARRNIPNTMGFRPARDYGEPEKYVPLAKRGEQTMQVSLPIFAIGVGSDIAAEGEARYRKTYAMSHAMAMLTTTSSAWRNQKYAERLFLSLGGGGAEGGGVLATMFSGMAFDPEAVFDELSKEIRRIASDGVDRELFARLRRPMLGGMYQALDDMSGVCMSVANTFFHGYDYFKLLEVAESVSADDVTEFFRTTLNPDNFAMFTIKPQGV